VAASACRLCSRERTCNHFICRREPDFVLGSCGGPLVQAENYGITLQALASREATIYYATVRMPACALPGNSISTSAHVGSILDQSRQLAGCFCFVLLRRWCYSDDGDGPAF
jgi:hypothetical protein